MAGKGPRYLNIDQCVDLIASEFGPEIRFCIPLGLGKPVPLVNALYQRVKRDKKLSLKIITALCLEKPTWANELERRFLQPFAERMWGGVLELDYMLDLRKGELPENVRLHEIFFKAGGYQSNPQMQQDHISTNYTYVVRDCVINGGEIFAQMIARRADDAGPRYSTSCNTDNALQTLIEYGEAQRQGKRRLRVGMVNSELPYMYGKAEVAPDMYDVIIDQPDLSYPLFGTPRLPVTDADYTMGLHVSSLIKDGGTLQIGIGALGDAIAYGLKLRQQSNSVFKDIIDKSGIAATYGAIIDECGGTGAFAEGLYGSTEMLVDAFLQLYKSGIIKRKVYHHVAIQSLVNQGKLSNEIPANILDLVVEDKVINPYLLREDFEALQHHGVFRENLRYEDGQILDGEHRYSANLADGSNRRALAGNCLGRLLTNGVLVTGTFFIGPPDFYDTLRAMPEDERRQFEMAGVEDANQLYGDEKLRRLQRVNARFCNTGMKATLLGHIVSDGLEDGTIVSGVGGQYNFVAMAHALTDARLIMMIKSTRQEHGKTLSNIVYNYGHATIPRHQRDIVVTEYGIADIRGRTDQEIVKAMLNVADSRFQAELLNEAKRARKISADYEIPEQYRNNTPQRIAGLLKQYKAQGYFPPFPFGSEFTRTELVLAHALKTLKAKSAEGNTAELAAAAKRLPAEPPPHVVPFLERMGLDQPDSSAESEMQRTLMLAMALAGVV